jgi:methylmalonyl-CoA/ethylmalonyl-CoA epimerase
VKPEAANTHDAMVIDHIAVVVRSIEQAIPLWQSAFGYAPMTSPVINTRQRVRVVFLAKKGSIVIKLVEPTDASSPVQSVAARGGGLHHLCFKCESLDDELRRLQQQGMRLLAGPEPGEAFDNEPIAFVYAGQGLNVELVATERKAARLQDGD